MVDWTPIHAGLHQTLKQRWLLPKHQPLLLAVSGGQDSLCLIRLLLDLQPKWNWKLGIAHCNHRWRPDAEDNADYVRDLAQAWQLPCFITTAPNLPHTEAAARQWRYASLTEMAITHGYLSIVTGHTASDRAETLLYNLTRGSGTDGLQALGWQRSLAPTVQLVRPLLNLTRADTATVCQTSGLKIWADPTNHDYRYARNRIRAEVLPYLKTHFNPQVEQCLAQTAEVLRAEVEYLEAAAEILWQQVVSEVKPAFQDQPRLLVQRVQLRAAPLALQRRVIRRLLKLALPSAPTFEHIEKLVTLLRAPNRSQTDPFPGGSIAQVKGDWVEVLLPTNCTTGCTIAHPQTEQPESFGSD